jgi:hypothetical protein
MRSGTSDPAVAVVPYATSSRTEQIMPEIKQVRNKMDALSARFAALRGYL